MDKFLYPTHPVRCIITGPSECGKSVFLTNLNLIIIDELEKIYIHSTSIHHDLYQILIKCFSNYIPPNIIPIIINAEKTDLAVDGVINIKDIEKSNTEIETHESIEELKYPQDDDEGGIIILDDLNEKEMSDPRAKAMFKRSRHNKSSIFIISQDYDEFPKRSIPANGNIYHIFKPSNFRYVKNLYQDKAPMDMTLNEFKYLTSTC